jgi:hypothetical protein
MEYTYRDVIIIILVACICIMFYLYVLRKTEICCRYCGATTTTDGTVTKPPQKEGFAPVNTKLEAAGPMDVRSLGALPLATDEKNHPHAGPNEYLIDDSAIGRA